MKWFMDLSIKNKVLLLFSLIFVAVIAVVLKVDSDLAHIDSKEYYDLISSSYYLLIFLAILIFALSLLGYFAIKKLVDEPLQNLSRVISKISLGDLDEKIWELNRKDELGLLSKDIFEMRKKLINITSLAENAADGDFTKKLQLNSEKDVLSKSINKMIDSFVNMNKNIHEEISNLSSTSTELNSIIAQLSSSVSETAASISQTTSTVDEVQKTTIVSTQKANEAAQAAENVSEAAEEGKTAIEETLEGVQLIKDQMNLIGQNIMQLTSQSKAIGEIISFVNDIAEQSNMLAVNAAIEAARAGEQGKSFVIVAQEIKNLSNQSKQATSKIGALLNDIQNSINKAVLATEKGEKVVNEQAEIAGKSGAAIIELTQTLDSVRVVVEQTSLTMNEQSIGMEQITSAMHDIKVAGEQNSVGAKQLHTASESLKNVGDNLTDTIRKIKF